MKKIVNYFKNFPKGVLILLSINIIVYLISLILNSVYSINSLKYLAAYSTSNERFSPYQIVTSIFTHSTNDYSHILSNLIFLLFFSVNVENKIGTKNFIILYFLSGLFAFVSTNFILVESYYEIISRYKVRLQDLPILQSMYLDEYKFSLETNYAYGSSGSVCGILGAYVILNIKNYLKSLYNFFILLLMTGNIMTMITSNFDTSTGGCFAHIGGFTFGILFSIFIILFKEKINLQTKKYNFI